MQINLFNFAKMNEKQIKEKRKIRYFEAIREATDQSMEKDESVIIIGEGVPDPKGIFGTTLGLQQKYGDKRVSDMPLSENAVTGACIGAALTGLRPILVHQRLDFVLLSLDQVINNAAKWHYMFGGKLKVPLVIRMVIGMGWGQGAQHSQCLQALFCHIPGLKVVMPSTAYDAKGLLISSIKDNNPVIFIEHRWLHNTIDYVPEEPYAVPLGKAKIAREGTDITIVSASYMTINAIKAADILKKAGISVEVIDVRTLKPLDSDTVLVSVKKTGHLLVADSGYNFCGFAAEIIAQASEKIFSHLKCPPQRITLPDLPTPSTPGLTKYYYPRHIEIIENILKMLKKENIKVPMSEEPTHLDVPDSSFTGPF